jgi:ribonuclease HI
LIEYYIDGSTKDNVIGVGIVKVNGFGFIEKHHFNVEHIKPSSNIAEGYSLEKALELINQNDINKTELINIYTDNQKLYNSLLHNTNLEFNNSDFFVKEEAMDYFQHIRSLYLELISKFSNKPIFYCDKTNNARPFIKIFFKDDVEDKKYLQDAHLLSRKYIKKEDKNLVAIELRAIRKDNIWHIVKNKKSVASNKRPLIALSDALIQINSPTKHIKLCDTLETILKSTNKNRLSNDSMKSAVKIIEDYKLLINL